MEHKLDEFIHHALSAQPISGTSLIISLYGDALSHRGGELWLGSISSLLAALGFSDRVVRTSVFRLQKEGWLNVEKMGRRSYYRLTDQGIRQFRHAESKIYLSALPEWDATWELLLLENAEKNERLRLKKELGWLGFGQITGNLMAAPTHPETDIAALLNELNASEQVIYFRATSPYQRSERTVRQMVADCWSLQQVAGYYHEFIISFRPLMALLRDIDDDILTPKRAFQIKLLLIHFFRRVVLKDPLLPDALLPAQWEGQIARNLCINIYQRVDRAATDYVSTLSETTIGTLPAPSNGYYRRFGGLSRDPITS